MYHNNRCNRNSNRNTGYDRVNKNGNLVKLSTKRKMNRYIDYPEEFEELLTTVIPQIYKM